MQVFQNIPWQRTQWQHIEKMHATDRLPHALLLEGRAGLGKYHFARQLAQTLLCQSGANTLNSVKHVQGGNGQGVLGMCGQCSSCDWFSKGSHPDYKQLSPEEGKKLISVDTIRATIKSVAQTSHQSGYRVLLINPADAMTTEAANSLLKTLEEPPPKTMIMLLTDKPVRLLPTIRSRATRIKFHQPSTELALSWMSKHGLSVTNAQHMLALSLGAPLRFETQLSNPHALIEQTVGWWKAWHDLQQQTLTPMQIAKEWKQAEPLLFLTWLDSLLCGLIEQNATELTAHAYTVLFPNLEQYKGRASFQQLFNLRDRVLILLQKLHTALNWPLQLESLAIECQALSR